MSLDTNARFCYNNFLDTGMTASSSDASYPVSNLVHSVRSKVWKPSYVFEVSSVRNKVYINGTTYTIPVSTYTVTTLITAFNTATGATLSRNSLGRFVITLGGSGTLNLGTTTNAIWDLLGFLETADITRTVFTADEARYSSGEWIKVDMGITQSCQFAALIMPSNTVFSAPNAVIKLQGNNLDLWDAPPVEIIMNMSAQGAFTGPPSATQACRFWRIFIKDRTNNALSFGVAYIGDATIFANTNIATGLTRSYEDSSEKLYAESGALFTDRRPKSLSLSSMNVQFLKGDELVEIEQLMYDLGDNLPFFLILDPTLVVSTNASEMTHYVTVSGGFTLSHVLNSYYNLSFQLKEYL